MTVWWGMATEPCPHASVTHGVVHRSVERAAVTENALPSLPPWPGLPSVPPASTREPIMWVGTGTFGPEVTAMQS